MAAPRAEVRIANGHRNRPLTPRQTQSIARLAFAPRMTEVILLALGPINAALVLDLAPAIVHLLGDDSRVSRFEGCCRPQIPRQDWRAIL
jgi:hypothetical protein